MDIVALACAHGLDDKGLDLVQQGNKVCVVVNNSAVHADKALAVLYRINFRRGAVSLYHLTENDLVV